MTAILKPTFVYEPQFAVGEQGQALLALTRVSRWRGLAGVLFDWAVIAGAAAAAVGIGHWLAYVAAIVVVGARQHALLILMHDAAHYRLFPVRAWNERLSNWLCAYPHLVATEAYRRDHLKHHFFLNTQRDPNWVPKIGKPDWEYPMAGPRVAWIFFRELCGYGTLRLVGTIAGYFGASRSLAKRAKRGRQMPFWGRLLYYALAAAAITWLGAWRGVLLLWFVPLFTVVPTLLRLRIVSEHYGLEREHDLNHSRNYRANLLERFLLAPHNVWLHLDHHLFPAIPFYNLPAAHALLARIPSYRDRAHESLGVLSPFKRSVLREVTSASPRAAPPPRVHLSSRESRDPDRVSESLDPDLWEGPDACDTVEVAGAAHLRRRFDSADPGYGL